MVFAGVHKGPSGEPDGPSKLGGILPSVYEAAVNLNPFFLLQLLPFDEHTGNYVVYFGGVTTGSYDAIQQTITTTPGVQYDLSFWLAGLAIGGPGSDRD